MQKIDSFFLAKPVSKHIVKDGDVKEETLEDERKVIDSRKSSDSPNITENFASSGSIDSKPVESPSVIVPESDSKTVQNKMTLLEMMRNKRRIFEKAKGYRQSNGKGKIKKLTSKAKEPPTTSQLVQLGTELDSKTSAFGQSSIT